MSVSDNRRKRGWFRRGDAPEAPAAPEPAEAPAAPVRYDDPWSADAWSEEGWDDEWNDRTRRARVRPAADPRAADVDAWLESPSLALLGEADGYWPELRRLLEAGRVSGPRVHDARVAAICLAHGVRELWTADRHFGRFPALKARNPLLD